MLSMFWNDLAARTSGEGTSERSDEREQGA